MRCSMGLLSAGNQYALMIELKGGEGRQPQGRSPASFDNRVALGGQSRMSAALRIHREQKARTDLI
jgi:hypothetical protein